MLSQSFGKLSKLVILTTMMAAVTACQTLVGPSEAERKQAELLATQKALIVNFLNKGLPGMANKELRTYLKKFPEDADFKNLMGLTMLALKNPQQAVKYFTQANKLEPRVPFALNIASAYIEAGRYEQAIDLLDKIKKNPEFEEYKFPERIDHNLGLAHERTKDLTAAQKHYELALVSNPLFYISLMRLGHIYHNKRDYKKSRQLYRRAHKTCLECFDPINGIAMSFISQGQPTKAIVALRRYIKTQKASKVDSKRATDMIKMAQKFNRSKKGQF